MLVLCGRLCLFPNQTPCMELLLACSLSSITYHLLLNHCPIFLCSPVSQIQEVISDRAVTQFCDWRHHALELIPSNACDHRCYNLFIETFFYTFLRAVALVNE